MRAKTKLQAVYLDIIIINNAQISILGIIDTSSKEFKLEGCLSRNSGNILKKSISKFVKSGNTIILDH